MNTKKTERKLVVGLSSILLMSSLLVGGVITSPMGIIGNTQADFGSIGTSSPDDEGIFTKRADAQALQLKVDITSSASTTPPTSGTVAPPAIGGGAGAKDIIFSGKNLTQDTGDVAYSIKAMPALNLFGTYIPAVSASSGTKRTLTYLIGQRGGFCTEATTTTTQKSPSYKVIVGTPIKKCIKFLPNETWESTGFLPLYTAKEIQTTNTVGAYSYIKDYAGARFELGSNTTTNAFVFNTYQYGRKYAYGSSYASYYGVGQDSFQTTTKVGIYTNTTYDSKGSQVQLKINFARASLLRVDDLKSGTPLNITDDGKQLCFSTSVTAKKIFIPVYNKVYSGLGGTGTVIYENGALSPAGLGNNNSKGAYTLPKAPAISIGKKCFPYKWVY